jgi:hypothetical protein
MSDVVMVCRLANVTAHSAKFGDNIVFDDSKITVLAHETISKRGGVANIRCPVGNLENPRNTFGLDGSYKIEQAHIFISAQFKTLWKSRQSEETEFTWMPSLNPARWTQGKVVH